MFFQCKKNKTNADKLESLALLTFCYKYGIINKSKLVYHCFYSDSFSYFRLNRKFIYTLIYHLLRDYRNLFKNTNWVL
jgi:hypothetical protein